MFDAMIELQQGWCDDDDENIFFYILG